MNTGLGRFLGGSADEAKATNEQVAVTLAFASVLMAIRVSLAAAVGVTWPAAEFLPFATFLLITAALARLGMSRLATITGCLCAFLAALVASRFWAHACFHVGRSFPTADDVFARADAFLGFDWVAYLRFIDAHAWLDAVLRPAYASIIWQPVAIVLLVPFVGRSRDALVLISAMALALAITLAVAGVTPAYGAYHYFGVTRSFYPHLEPLATEDGMALALDWLRSAVPSGVMPAERGGLVSFPSFHTACALTYAWSCRNCRTVMGIVLPWEGAMLLATPVQGSHYLVDMLAGAGVAVGAIAACEFLLPRGAVVRKVSKREAGLAPAYA